MTNESTPSAWAPDEQKRYAEAMTKIGVKTASNTPTSLVAPFDFDRLVTAIERCAVALETLASDVKPPASQPLIFEPTKIAPPRETAKILEAPAATPVVENVMPATPPEDVTKKIENLDWNDEAASLEKTFADNEAAKRILGDALYAEVWVTPLQEQASIATATALRDVTIKTLGSRAAFEKARDATGIKAGTIPTGEQARRLVLEHVVKAVVK